jgi:hypothetical protein
MWVHIPLVLNEQDLHDNLAYFKVP